MHHPLCSSASVHAERSSIKSNMERDSAPAAVTSPGARLLRVQSGKQYLGVVRCSTFKGRDTVQRHCERTAARKHVQLPVFERSKAAHYGSEQHTACVRSQNITPAQPPPRLADSRQLSYAVWNCPGLGRTPHQWKLAGFQLPCR